MESTKSIIPEDYTDFLYWVKEQTEAYWSKNPETCNDYFVCEKWAYGARWMGLSDSEIDSIERKYEIKFSYEHRLFLKVLHAVDKQRVIEYTETFDEDEEVKYDHQPFFYNWQSDEAAIKEYLDWPYRTMLQDVLGANKVWLKSWGKKRPQSNEEKESIFSEWFKQVPRLLPLTGHQFVVSHPTKNESPVLSMWGTDILVYGWNMKYYILNQLGHALGLYKLVYDQEDLEWYAEPGKELQELQDLERKHAKENTIPVLEEMILYWSSGWWSYGKEYPYPDDSTVQPIVKTYVPEDESEEPNQKSFNQYRDI